MTGDTAITVEKLIEHLKTLPPRAECYYSYCSAWAPLAAEDVTAAMLTNKRGFADIPRTPEEQALGKTVVLFPGN
jgi:hypothetical protein